MYVYAFVKTVPGMGSQVAAALVRAGAERAVELTGPYDVAARFAKQTWDGWAEFKNGPSTIAGIVSITTMVVSAPTTMNVSLAQMPFSDPRWGPSGLVLMNVAPADAKSAWRKLSVAKRDGTIKAMVPLLGEYDLLAQVSGRDEHEIAGKTLETLQEIPEVRRAVTCLILRGVPAANYPSPRGSGGYGRKAASAKRGSTTRRR